MKIYTQRVLLQTSPSQRLFFITLSLILVLKLSSSHAFEGITRRFSPQTISRNIVWRKDHQRKLKRRCATEIQEFLPENNQQQSIFNGTILPQEAWAGGFFHETGSQSKTFSQEDPIGIERVLGETDDMVQKFMSQDFGQNSTVTSGVGSSVTANANDVLKIAKEAAEELNLNSDSITSSVSDTIRQELVAPVKDPFPSTHKEKKVLELPTIPSTQELMRFALPAIAMLQAPAIMSVVDTAVVGRHSSLELAALSPASQMCDALTFIFSFVGMATSNGVARALAKGDDEEVQKTVAHSFSMAIGIGLFSIFMVKVFGKAYMTLCVGEKALSVIPPAVIFAHTRILGAVAIMLTMVGQATSLGLKDSVTPLVVIAINALVNLFGDIFLVVRMGLGIKGAAIATAASECVGAALMINSIRKKFPQRKCPFIKVPSFREFKKFMLTAGPLFFMLFTRSACFAWLASTIATAGTVSLGAYQILLRITFILTGFGDGLSLAAQSYLPSYNLRSAQDPVSHKSKHMLISKIMKLAIGAGVFTSFIGAFVALKLPFLFTSDALVIAEVRKTVPLLVGVLSTYAISLPMEGILISMQDGAFMAKMYGGLLLVKVSYLELAKRVPVLSNTLALSAWAGLVLYNFGRTFSCGMRIFLKDRQEKKVLERACAKEMEEHGVCLTPPAESINTM